jgi:hypothetical protein
VAVIRLCVSTSIRSILCLLPLLILCAPSCPLHSCSRLSSPSSSSRSSREARFRHSWCGDSGMTVLCVRRRCD